MREKKLLLAERGEWGINLKSCREEG